MNREADSAGPNGNGILTFDPDSEDGASQPAPKAKAKPKAKGAASLTADVVSRGRQRTQVYGEAGLWRGAAVPPPSEAPVRVAFPPVREPVPDLGAQRDAERDTDAGRQAEREELAREALGPAETIAPIEPAIPTREPAEREGDLATQVIGALLVFAAVFVLGILLF